MDNIIDGVVASVGIILLILLGCFVSIFDSNESSNEIKSFNNRLIESNIKLNIEAVEVEDRRDEGERDYTIECIAFEDGTFSKGCN